MTKRNSDPFYAWLDHEEIRDLVNRARDLDPGERLVLLKGLVPDLIDALGLERFEAFLDEIRTKARRFDEARSHPGAGYGTRETPGEPLGGPTPGGRERLDGYRDPHRPGGRDAERHDEAEAWVRARDRERRGGKGGG